MQAASNVVILSFVPQHQLVTTTTGVKGGRDRGRVYG